MNKTSEVTKNQLVSFKHWKSSAAYFLLLGFSREFDCESCLLSWKV